MAITSIAVGVLLALFAASSTPSSRQYSVASAGAEGFAKTVELLGADVLVDLEGLTGAPADRSILIAAR
ncbi:MAG: hypothetical protein N3H31_08090, partial [Candidatus Nezhaarchaeota archaeon]|nr:hypothetical protein [Candidatus Nezhaarchaeota archaeon]